MGPHQVIQMKYLGLGAESPRRLAPKSLWLRVGQTGALGDPQWSQMAMELKPTTQQRAF